MKDPNSFLQLSRQFLEEKNIEQISKEKYEELLDVLRFHERKYYIDHSPVISDTEYDILFKLAEKVEEENPEWITPMSLTQQLGSDRLKVTDTDRKSVV